MQAHFIIVSVKALSERV